MKVSSRRRRRQRRMRDARRLAGFLLRRVLPLLVIVIVAAEFWPRAHQWLLTSPSCAVQRILISGNRFLTPRELADIAGVRPGMPMIEIEKGDVERRLALHPRVRRARLGYVFPRSLRIRVDERVPVAVLEYEGLTPVSADGVVLPPVPGRITEALPVLIPPSDMRVEGNLVGDRAVREALGFLGRLDAIDQRLARSTALVDLTHERFTRVHLDTLSTALVYEKGGEWEAHVRALPAVVDDLTRSGISGAVLDLRFRQQIVRRGGELAVVDRTGKPKLENGT